jgi:5'-3' exonuclease
MTRVHIVDGTFELYRAHYSKRPAVTDAAGADRKATVGVVQSMQALLRDRDEAVTHLAVAFDNPIRSFRNDLFAGYKSDEGVPSELRAQFDIVEAALRQIGIVVWRMVEFEADDALASAAHQYRDVEVRLLSPDKDLAQALRPGVVRVDRIRKTFLSDMDVPTALGVPPNAIADLLALTGDPQDGIPGLRGFGQVAARTLLTRYGSLDAIPNEHWNVSLRGRETLEARFREERDHAFLYRTLARLRVDVPIPPWPTLAVAEATRALPPFSARELSRTFVE